MRNSQPSPTGVVSEGIAASEYLVFNAVSTVNTFRWLQLYLATSLLVIDLGLVAIVANLETQRDLNNLQDNQGLATWSAFNLDGIFSEYSIVMTFVGFGSYLLLLVHLFLLPKCPTVSDLLTLFNIA